MAKDKRININIKLRHGRDDDLIGWLKNLPTGTSNQRGGRNETIVTLLRAAVFDDPVPAPPDALRVENERLQGELAWMVAQHEADLHALNARLEALEKRPNLPVAETETPEVEGGERISETTKSTRKTNLLKAKW